MYAPIQATSATFAALSIEKGVSLINSLRYLPSQIARGFSGSIPRGQTTIGWCRHKESGKCFQF